MSHEEMVEIAAVAKLKEAFGHDFQIEKAPDGQVKKIISHYNGAVLVGIKESKPVQIQLDNSGAIVDGFDIYLAYGLFLRRYDGNYGIWRTLERMKEALESFQPEHYEEEGTRIYAGLIYSAGPFIYQGQQWYGPNEDHLQEAHGEFKLQILDFTLEE